MIRVGLIGFGLAGQAFHAPMIRGVKGMELACVLERKTNNAKTNRLHVIFSKYLTSGWGFLGVVSNDVRNSKYERRTSK